MFKKIRHRLLLSYLLVFASILGGFAVAVRVVFAHSLKEQLTSKLTALGQGAAANVEYEKGRLKIESDFPIKDIISQHQALQWFNLQGDLIAQEGNLVLKLPLSFTEIQSQAGKSRIQSVTLPIISSDNKKVIGYVRVSQSLEEFDETLKKLDLGLGGGVFVALVISGVGGVWLTRQAMREIEDSFERLKQFTADASHELRSPLMVIKSNAAVALKYSEGIRETDVEKFEAIASASRQMTRLTEDLLFLARQDQIKPRNLENVNLTEILDNLVQLYQPQAEAKKINLKSEISRGLDLWGDSIQLKRLFTNLIENAIYYTPNQGMIEIKASGNSCLIINIQDTGVGILAPDLERVFQRFWRADKSRHYHSGGSGLGLAIAQAIAQNHNGLITVTSQVGVGSCFTTRFPVT